MPRRSSSGDPPGAGRALGQLSIPAFSAPEWELLTRLPGRVIVVATSIEVDRPRRTVAEGLAGLAAIAAGRAFDSDLVRAVVASIYTESDEDRPVNGRAVDPDVDLAALLTSCRQAVRVLVERADPADSAAYRQWVQCVAARGFDAGRPRALPPFGVAQLAAAERQFLNDLGIALALA
ncbi:hypothetical protein [Micromonospora sp. NPDC049679]|uniref:hypothetical protein n=1 Tax=Micromonospora sp. NPDC049679 TaxID=3155920 RepID=UPI0033F872CB